MNNETPEKTVVNKSVISMLIFLLVLSLGISVWNLYEINSLKDDDYQQTIADETTQTETASNGWDTAVISGNNGFQVNLPDGWGPLVNAQDSDFLIMQGTTQPSLSENADTVIEETDGYGSDNLSLFSILIKDIADDSKYRGNASDYTLTNGKENPIDGKKHVYIYETDEVVGLGHQRYVGDRDYTYTFPLGGNKELSINYSVYGSDPRNLAETVEAIIETIRVPAPAS